MSLYNNSRAICVLFRKKVLSENQRGNNYPLWFSFVGQIYKGHIMGQFDQVCVTIRLVLWGVEFQSTTF